jgi:general secretion pathway protein D
MAETNFFSKRGQLSRKILFTAALLTMFLFANSQAAKPLSNKIFTLRNIPVEKAIETLTQLGIGDSVNKVKDVNAIIVTATQIDLSKAGAIVHLIDSTADYEIKTLPMREGFDVPAINKYLAGKFKDVSFGTFVEPPLEDFASKVLIDSLGDKFILAAPKDTINGISESIDAYFVVPVKDANAAMNLQDFENKISQEISAAIEPNGLADSNVPEEQDEFFNDAMKSLEKAEQDKQLQAQEAEKIETDVNAADVNAVETQLALPAEANEVKVAESPKEQPVLPAKAPFVSLAEPIISDANQTIELTLPEKVSIINLLDLVGEYMKLDYMYDETKITGDITLKVQGPITIKALYSYIEAVLKSKGFAMVRGRGNLVMIVPSADAVGYDPSIVGAGREVEAGNVFVTTIFELSYIDTATATRMLTEMKMGASIVQLPEAGTLIINDYANRMQRIEDLLKIIDKPGKPKEIKFRQIEFITVSSLIPKLENLAQQLGTISISTTITSSSPQSAAASAAARRWAPANPAVQPGQPQPVQPGQATATSTEKTLFLEADERTNRIIMIGNEEQIATVNGLIDSLDIRQKDFREIRKYDIENVAAEEVQAKLTEMGLSSQSTSTSSTGSTARSRNAPNVQQGQPGQPGQPGQAGSEAIAENTVGDLAQVVLLDATNSLLINATPEQHEKIQTMLSYIDQASLETATPYVVYRLEYQKPDELAEVLSNIVEKTVNAQDEKGKIVKVPTSQEVEITIVPDVASFSIIVYANRKDQEWVGKLIKNLDKKRPQVLIDVTLVEVTKEDSFEQDLNIVQSFPDLTQKSSQTSLINTPLLPTSNDRFIDLQTNNGNGTAFYGDKHIQALLKLVESKSYGRVLAKPKILVNDNEAGIIDTTNTTYVVQTGEVRNSTNDDITTTTEFKSYDAGIKLEITPHISEGELLLLEIVLTRSDFTGELTGEIPPDTVKTTVDTMVTVPDTKTIILGGLLKLNQNKSGSKVPLLGDIPLIGTLFRSTSNSDLQSKLYVFVRAQISRPREDESGLTELVEISREHEEAFEAEEEKFQERQSIPGIKPSPVEPAKVLKAK